MKRVLVSLVVFVALMLISIFVANQVKAEECCLTSCFTPPKPPEPLIIKFSYDPPSTSAQSLDITLAVAKSERFFTKKNTSEDILKIEKAFIDSMGADLQKILIAKGFKTTGPFESINEMTYPEKEKANLIFSFDITKLVHEETNTRTDSPGDFTLGSTSGNWMLRGFITFILQDPITNEKMWFKKLDISTSEIPFKFYFSRGGIIKDKDNRAQTINKLFKEIYSDSMGKLWTYIDPTEVANLVKQVEEIRKRKTF